MSGKIVALPGSLFGPGSAPGRRSVSDQGKDPMMATTRGLIPTPGHTPRKQGASGLSRRDFLRVAGLAAGGAALGACIPSAPSATSTSSGPVELVYQDWRTPWFPPMAQEMLDQFHASHPNIRVYYIPDPENFEQDMLQSFQNGTAADVFQGCCAHFPIWAQRGYALDLRPYVEADIDQATIQDWDPAQYQAFFTPDGVQYGLPKYHGALALYYNKDIFDTYEVDYPDGSWDHDDYLQAMRLLTHDLDGDGDPDIFGSIIDVSWDRLQVHVNGWGGHFVDPNDSAHSLMCEPGSMAALQWLNDRIVNDRVLGTLPGVQNLGTREAFVAERVAMAEDGSWALKDILSSATFRVGVAPFPAGPVRKVTLATTDGFGIYAGTRHPEAAWELVKFLISQDYGRAMARANFLQPARASLVEDWIGYIREEYPEQTAGMDIAAFAEGHIQGYSVVAEVFANMEEAKRIAYETWDQVFSLGQPLGELMADACERIQQAQQTSG
jgi:multiple sugar transport system substrate-binding protein